RGATPRRQVTVHHELAKPGEHRLHAIENGCPRGRAKGGLLLAADGRGHGLERGVVRTELDRINYLPGDLGGNAAQRDRGLGPSLGHAATQQIHYLRHVGWIGGEPGEIVVVFLLAGERHDLDELTHHQMRAVQLVQGEKLVGELLALDRDFFFPLEEIVRQRVLFGEAGAGNPAQSRQHVAVMRLAPFDRSRREVGEFLVVAMVALPGCGLGVLTVSELPVGSKELPERVGVRLLGLGRTRADCHHPSHHHRKNLVSHGPCSWAGTSELWLQSWIANGSPMASPRVHTVQTAKHAVRSWDSSQRTRGSSVLPILTWAWRNPRNNSGTSM